MKPNEDFLNSMRQALALLRTHGPAEATEAIQRALRGDATAPMTAKPIWELMPEPTRIPGAYTGAPGTTARSAVEEVAELDRGHFTTHTFSNAAGSRQYRLYVPAHEAGEPMPLIVMLHGCTQNADDFAAGTQMNALAERHHCLVAYPVQPQQANAQKCWNWFKPGDQQRERGEPALIAGITREIMAAYDVDPARVYVAGMSAGGAMAAIMIASYPELYAAAGVHSGLPAGSAHDLPSALAAMKGGMRARQLQHATPGPQRPVIVFHGDADATVNVHNATRLVEGFDARPHDGSERREGASGRRAYTVSRRVSPDGVESELWTIHGAPHAWAGGSTRGSYTDPSGPDASAEMLRFFLDHPQRH